MLPYSVSEQISIYIYWDSYEQFREKLYPIARQAYLQFGIKAVIVTSYWKSLPDNLLEEQWLTVYRLQEFEVKYKTNRRIFERIGDMLTANSKEIRFWRQQAQDIMNTYNPVAVYMWKPYIKEIPFFIKIAKNKRINTFFIGEYNVTFNLKSFKKLFHNSIVSSAKNDAQNSNRILFWGSFLLIYLINRFLTPILQYITYISFGIWDWKRTLATIPSISYHCVSNELFRKEFLRLNASPKRIIATGVPEQDALFELNVKKHSWDVKSERQKLGIGKQKNLVVFLLENFPALRSELNGCQVNTLIENVTKEVLKLPNTEFLIKVHPRDTQDYSWITDKYPEVCVRQKLSTISLVSLADIILAHGSTSVSMSLPMNCPALLINFYNY
jgi:hypothetical protein